MKRKVLLLLVIAAIFISQSCEVLSVGNERVSYQELKGNLINKMPELLKKYRIPGASIALIHAGKIEWTRGFGMADKKGNVKVDETTVFQSASISKSLTTWGILKLYEKGKIDLDEPADNYLKRWHFPHSEYDTKKITIRDLLNHTSGIASVTYPGYPEGEVLPSLEQSLSGKTGVSIEAEAGKKFTYSGAGYTVLQLLIEDVTGQDFSEYMKNEILEPLGMRNSTFEYTPELKSKIAKPYGFFGEEFPNYFYTEKAAAGLYTTASDLAEFVAAGVRDTNKQFRSNGLIKPELIELSYQPNKGNYGFGNNIFTLTNGSKTVSHGGDNRGWNSGYMSIPDEGEGIVILTNSENGCNLIWDVLDIWTQWNAGKTQKFYADLFNERKTLNYCNAAAGALLLLYLVLILRGFIIKKYIFIGRSTKKTYRKILSLLIPILFIFVWLLLFYTGTFFNGWLPASRLPWGFGTLSLFVCLWALSFAFKGLFPKNKSPGKSVGGEKDGFTAETFK